MRELGARGVTRLMVEGGSRVAATLLRAGLVDDIAWFRSSNLIGGDGLPAMSGLGVESMQAIHKFERTEVRALGPDVLETFKRRD